MTLIETGLKRNGKQTYSVNRNEFWNCVCREMLKEARHMPLLHLTLNAYFCFRQDIVRQGPRSLVFSNLCGWSAVIYCSRKPQFSVETLRREKGEGCCLGGRGP